MNRDKKILFGLGIFICSIVMISVIKGTYAYPSTMENTGGGRIVPLGGDEVCSKCDNSYVYAPVGADNCTPVADSYCTSKPSTGPSTPTPPPSSKPTTPPTTPSTPVIPTSPKEKECWRCLRPYEYIYGYRSDLPLCDTGWFSEALSEKECHPSETTSPEACYVCSNNENMYHWGEQPSSGSNSCSGSWKKTGLSENECHPSETTPTPNSYCYVCSTDDNKFYWGVYPVPSSISSSCSGTWKGTARTQEQCHAEDIPSNPNTGDVMLYIAYLIGFSSLFYSGYSFYRYKKQNNK